MSRTLLAAAAVVVLLWWPSAARAQSTPPDTTSTIAELKATADAQAKTLKAMQDEMAALREAVLAAVRATTKVAPDQVQQSYRDAVRAQAARCGRQGFRFVAVGKVDGKDAALCIADLPKDLER